MNLETIWILVVGAGILIFSNHLVLFGLEWNERVFGRMGGPFARWIVRTNRGGRAAGAYWPHRVATIFVGVVFVVVGLARMTEG